MSLLLLASKVAILTRHIITTQSTCEDDVVTGSFVLEPVMLTDEVTESAECSHGGKSTRSFPVMSAVSVNSRREYVNQC